jgi:tetratricopeptide (TPR) repeat protein
MKPFFFTSILVAMTTINSAKAQQADTSVIKNYEHQLEDVMELSDTSVVKNKLEEVEQQFKNAPNQVNKTRLGIIYHETALNLSFLAKSPYKGYAQKSFDLLSELFNSAQTEKELLPFIASYRASALSLVAAETKKLNLIGRAFGLFEEAVKNYAAVSYLPEFLRGSVAENLPWVFFEKRKYAKTDFQSIINKQERNANYANWKIMSFAYWAWANQYQGKKHRAQAIAYLNRAIELDPNYQAGRAKAEQLKAKLVRK